MVNGCIAPWLLSLSLLQKLGNTCTTIAAMPCKHYFMTPTSLAAFPSVRPGCFFAHVTELFGKAQTRASRCTICPLPYKAKHGVGKVLAFSLMLKLKGQHLEYQFWPFAWPPVQFAFLWSAAKCKVNQQGFVKSNKRGRERELDESMSWKLLN